MKRKAWNCLMSTEQEAWFRANQLGKTASEMAELLNKKYGTELTPQQIKAFRKNHKIKSGLDGFFQKGHIPPNKGKKMSAEQYEKCKATMFQKGHKPHNKMKVGAIVTDAGGYLKKKIAQPNVWKHVHKIVWEKVHGRLKPGEKIIFLDGDKQNCKIKNLLKVTDGDVATMNHLRLFTKDAELTKAWLSYSRLRSRLYRLKAEKAKEEADD